MEEGIKPTVTWEQYCQVTQLCIAVLADNAQLREQRKLDHQTVNELIRQREELWDRLKAAGLGPKIPERGTP